MPRAHILYVIPGRALGGIATGLAGMLRRLDRRRWRATAAAPPGPALSFLRGRGVSCLALPERGRVEFLLRAARRGRVRLVQSCDAAAEGARAAALLGLPHVWFIGGPLRVGYRGLGSGPRKAFRSLVERLSDAVVFHSRGLRGEDFPGLPADKSRVIPWGVDAPRLPRRIGSPARGPRVGMVGNFFPGKRHSDFLRAARAIRRELPLCRFAIAGRTLAGPARGMSLRCLGRVRRQARRLGLERSLEIRPFSDRGRDAWYRGLDLLLIPSYDGMGQSVLEAGARGTAVVSVRAGCAADVIEHGRSGLLTRYQDPEALARAALSLLRDPARRRRLGRALRRRVRERFSARVQAARFARLYAALLRP